MVFGSLLEATSTNSVDPEQTVPDVGEFGLGPHGSSVNNVSKYMQQMTSAVVIF